MEYNVGDIVRTKKPHPCGSKLWKITRVGVDFGLKCEGCGDVYKRQGFRDVLKCPIFYLKNQKFVIKCYEFTS